MGSPFSGRGHNFLIAYSIGLKSLAEPCYQFLRDVVTFWVVCGPWSTLDRERRISLVISLSSFRMRSPFSGQVEYNFLTIEGLAQLQVTVSLFQSTSLTVVAVLFSFLQGKGLSVSVVIFYSYGLNCSLALKSWDLVLSQEVSKPAL